MVCIGSTWLSESLQEAKSLALQAAPECSFSLSLLHLKSDPSSKNGWSDCCFEQFHHLSNFAWAFLQSSCRPWRSYRSQRPQEGPNRHHRRAGLSWNFPRWCGTWADHLVTIQTFSSQKSNAVSCSSSCALSSTSSCSESDPWSAFWSMLKKCDWQNGFSSVIRAFSVLLTCVALLAQEWASTTHRLCQSWVVAQQPSSSMMSLHSTVSVLVRSS